MNEAITYTEADIDALNRWLAKNRLHFKFNNYTPDEVTYLAMLDGHNHQLVYKVLSHFDDALAGTSIDRRARAKAAWFQSEVLIPSCLDLDEQWNRLGRYLEDGVEFEEVA